VAPVQQRVTVGELLDDLLQDVQLRGLKSAAALVYHIKPIREHFRTMRAVDVTSPVVDK